MSLDIVAIYCFYITKFMHYSPKIKRVIRWHTKTSSIEIVQHKPMSARTDHWSKSGYPSNPTKLDPQSQLAPLCWVTLVEPVKPGLANFQSRVGWLLMDFGPIYFQIGFSCEKLLNRILKLFSIRIRPSPLNIYKMIMVLDL